MTALARNVIAIGIVATTGFVTLRGQPERPAPDDMKALVAEVRALRQAVERSTATASQAQVLLGRVQLQENRLATLGRQYQEARTRSLDAQMGEAEQAQRLQQMTAAVGSITDPNERQAFEQQIASLKGEAARYAAHANQVRSDEAAAYEALSTEQRRWSDFNERLEALERTLAGGSGPRE